MAVNDDRYYESEVRIVRSREAERRKADHIQWQQEALSTPPDQPWTCSFDGHNMAVKLLAKVAAADREFADEAREVLQHWRAALATPDEMALVDTHTASELCAAAVTSRVPEEGGLWISTWTWVYCDPVKNRA